QVVDVQRCQRVVDEALEEFARQVDVELADMRAREREMVIKPRATRKIDHHARQRFVQRYIRVAIAAQAGLVSDSGRKGLAQRDAYVFNGVVVIDMGVAI